MSEINLTWCPEGGEHEWVLWYDENEAHLIIDCVRCEAEVHSGSFPSAIATLRISPIPVRLDQQYLSTLIEVDPRREV